MLFSVSLSFSFSLLSFPFLFLCRYSHVPIPSSLRPTQETVQLFVMVWIDDDYCSIIWLIIILYTWCSHFASSNNHGEQQHANGPAARSNTGRESRLWYSNIDNMVHKFIHSQYGNINIILQQPISREDVVDKLILRSKHAILSIDALRLMLVAPCKLCQY